VLRIYTEFLFLGFNVQQVSLIRQNVHVLTLACTLRVVVSSVADLDGGDLDGADAHEPAAPLLSPAKRRLLLPVVSHEDRATQQDLAALEAELDVSASAAQLSPCSLTIC
jgi:hypothetical protein